MSSRTPLLKRSTQKTKLQPLQPLSQIHGSSTLMQASLILCSALYHVTLYMLYVVSLPPNVPNHANVLALFNSIVHIDLHATLCGQSNGTGTVATIVYSTHWTISHISVTIVMFMYSFHSLAWLVVHAVTDWECDLKYRFDCMKFAVCLSVSLDLMNI